MVSAVNLMPGQCRMWNSKPRDSAKSIAVLPFVNMSTDAENEYFSDCITEELLNALTR